MSEISDDELRERNINLVKQAMKYLLEIFDLHIENNELKAKIEEQKHLIQSLLKEKLTLVQQLELASARPYRRAIYRKMHG